MPTIQFNGMQNPEQPLLTFSDLMAKVGILLFVWSGLEQELGNSIKQMRENLRIDPSKISGGLDARLALWFDLVCRLPENQAKAAVATEVREQALALRRIRNLIVHGLQGGSSLPPEGPAFIICAEGGYEEPTGKSARYTADDLEHFTQGIDACRRAFISLDHFNYRIALAEGASQAGVVPLESESGKPLPLQGRGLGGAVPPGATSDG